MAIPYRDRCDAGRQLASRLSSYAGRSDVVVLGLPRGGIPVAFEVAAALDAPLDAFLVRKLGVPGHEELAMGAIASGGLRVLNDEVVAQYRIPKVVIDAVEVAERRELARRERLYRGSRPIPDLRGQTVVLVDDGLATGSTMRAAAKALRQLGPAWLVGAVPVAAGEVVEAMAGVVDEMVCAETPEPFYAVGLWYDNFAPTSDEEVCNLLRRSEARSVPHLAPRAGTKAGALVDLVSAAAHPLAGDPHDYDPLIDVIGDARFVLLGEASHGTHEFYRERARITRRLIDEQGFSAVVVEADWPDAYRVNRFVRGASDDPDAAAALGDFHRFPRWMWRNTEVRDFVSWLREHNDGLPPGARKVGFYGMDLYSLGASIEAVIGYLEKVDPDGARRARSRYACFDLFGDDPQSYGLATTLGTAEPCENEAVGQLVEMQRRATELAQRDGRVAEDEFFFAEQNARLAKNAERYYRAMFWGRISSWNLRDRHMAETLDALVPHLERHGGPAKVVIWAHNSHLGDARATELGKAGELNLGQLVRERYGRDAVLIGFSTYRGTVTAATDWDAPAQRRRVRPGLPGSYEALFDETGNGDFFLTLRGASDIGDGLREPRLQRAIGVVYRPETERFSHYFTARLADQFDAIVHLNETVAVEPLDRDAGWEVEGELPETFPFGV
jgi:erythromycin esterase-like protein/adenine/guanine phosphoribosyltransferase-like PRPP-binding protein